MKDLGTYHVRIELENGKGWISKWDTGGRFTHGTENESPLEASYIHPTYENEEELIKNILYMYLEGNFSCDCNKNLFLSRAYQIKEVTSCCGHNMKIVTITMIRPDNSQIIIGEPTYV